jgi:ABC-type polysaccharide/polyol phosphate transport system ATPase subunit
MGVSKSFRHGGGAKLLRAYFRDLFQKSQVTDFFALRNVSFRVEDGESLAVVGRNGAGKSTLLSLVAGLTEPVEGSVAVKGRVAALLELGAGFHPDLTGVENLHLNASLLGLSRKRTAEVYEGILAFAGIGDFIYEPIRTYSMGMTMRLAFAIAVNVDPDILIVDEVLAVGDQAFQEKCRERIRGFKAQGKTLLFVSHSGPMVRELCNRALWLERGQILLDGPAAEVLDAYSASDAP